MAEEAVQLFLKTIEELEARGGETVGSGELPAGFTVEDGSRRERAVRFRDDLVAALAAPSDVDIWDPEQASTEELFATFTAAAAAYLAGGDEDCRPFLRAILTAVRELREEPQYIRAVLPMVAMSPGERWELLAHAGIHYGAVSTAHQDRWPVPREQIDATAARLTDPELVKGANWHVKHLREMGFVKVSRKPRLYDQLKHDPTDLYLFVSLTDEAPRVLSLLGFPP